jgi:hypothetical protein
VNALEKFEVKRSFFAMFAPDSRQAVLIYISIFLTMANIAVGTTFGLIENSNALVVDAMFGLAAVIRDFGLLAMLKMYRNQVKDGHHPMHIIGIDSKMGLIGSVLVFGVFLHMFMSIGLELPHLTPEGDPLMVIVGTSTGLVLNLSQMFIALLLSTDSGLKDMRYLKEVKGENGETSLQLGAADSGESKKSFAVISQMLTIASECLGNLPPLISGFISMYGTPELGARVDAGLAMLLIVGLSVLMFKESIIPAFLNEGANVADSNALNWFVNSLHEKYGLPSYQIVETHDSGKTVVCILIPKGRYDVAPLPSEQIGNANPGFFARLGQKAREMLWNGKSGAAENAETEPLLVSDEPAPIDESDFEYEAKGPIKDLNLDEMRSIRNDGLEVGITVTFKSIEQANAQQLGPDRIASAAFSRLSKPPSFGRHGI